MDENLCLTISIMAILALPLIYPSQLVIAQTNSNITSAATGKQPAVSEQRSNVASLNPPFRSCTSDFAVYMMEGTTTSGKLPSNLSGKHNLTIIINNNMAIPLLERLVVDNNQSVDSNVEHLTTQCIHKFATESNSSTSQNRLVRSIESNPPFRSCDRTNFESTIYVVKATSNDTQLLQNLTQKRALTTLITNNLLLSGKSTGKTIGLLGNLIVDSNKTVDLNIDEADTYCINKAF
jgi:hypothetical protein